MKRRDFSNAAVVSCVGLQFAGDDRALAVQSDKAFDRFGGWKGKTFDATGFFRTEHDGKRWWLVTPEGNAFLSWGINHLHADLWRQDFNREVWSQTLGVDDFQDWPKFNAALRSWFLKVCDQYGFNSVGVHTSLNVTNRPKPAMPYMQPIKFVDIPHWRSDVPDENFLDVFSPEFSENCDALAREATKPRDPYLIGYSMTDCPLMTEEDCRERPDVIGGARRKSRIGWPRRLRNLGAGQAGKIAYVETMKTLYRGSISDFNMTYATKFDSFDALANAENWRPSTDLSNGNETRDNVEFLKRVVAKYYAAAKSAICRHDPNHMFFGDKLNGNTDTMDTVLPVTSQFTDVVMYQMYGRYEVQKPGLDRWSAIAKKPMINGDASFTMVADFMPRPYGPVADDLQQRAEWTAEFFMQAFARADFVGWHYCGLMDATQQVPRKQARQHSGLMNSNGVPYPELLKTLRSCADELYEIASHSRS